MNKGLFLIALIAVAACSNTFLGDLKKNYQKAREEFEVQQRKLQRLQAKAEKLQDLAANAGSNGGAEAEVIVDTINGLTEAAKFWGSFTGKNIFDKDVLSKKISELEQKRALLQHYCSEDGLQAMTDLNQAIWQIDVTIKSIHSLAVQLKKGAKNVQTITRIAFKSGAYMLEGKDLTIYNAAIKVLVNTLKTANKNCESAATKLDDLAEDLNEIDKTMQQTAKALKETANGKSKEYDEYAHDMRSKVYGGCTASVFLGPAGVAACYSIGAGVLESDLADYRKRVDNFKKDFENFASTFTDMAAMANQTKEVSKHWYLKITTFQDEVSTQYDLISGVQDALAFEPELRTMVSDGLDTLIVECDKIINDTTGQLNANDVQALNAELEMNASFPELSSEQIAEQANTVCSYLKDPRARKTCVTEAIARMN